MTNHPIKKGPEGGQFQQSKAGDRYLLDNKKVKTGPQGGHYQTYDGGKSRYLLKVSKVAKK
jgi:hypothetical protein